MKVLLTGKNGMLAQDLLRRAQDENRWHWIPLSSPELDITNEQQIEAQLQRYRPDVVLNCAAYTRVDQAESEQERAYAVNGGGPGRLAEGCLEHGARLIHVSTDFVFDGFLRLPYDETARPNPQSAYGRSKLEGERNIAAMGGTWSIVRTSWLFGRYGGNFVKTMLRLAAERDELRVVADQIGSPTWTYDLAQGLLQLVRRPHQGLLHYGGLNSCSWYELARFSVERAYQLGMLESLPRIVPIRTKDFPLPAQRPAYSVLDSTRFRQATGHAPMLWQAAVCGFLQDLQDEQDHQ